MILFYMTQLLLTEGMFNFFMIHLFLAFFVLYNIIWRSKPLDMTFQKYIFFLDGKKDHYTTD
jgi:hypothetical protein